MASHSGPQHKEKSAGRQKFENGIEGLLFSSRWLLMPLYVGLVLGLFVLVVKFLESFWHLLSTITSYSMSDTTLGILELLDIALLGNLILIVIFSGYENFVSKINVAEDSEDRPSWMGKVDFSGLKIKLIGSLVAISVIELLKDFLDPAGINPEQEIWLIAIHLTFVVSGVLFAVMDYISDKRAQVDIEAERKELELRRIEQSMGMTQQEIYNLDPTGE